MEDRPELRVGIVGCGYQGNMLAQAIQLVDSLVVTAAADIIPERAAELAAKAGQAGAYSSAEELLANSEVDVVMVATPHYVLAPITHLAIAAGKHIMCEKPCGMNAGEIAGVEESVARARVSYLAGYSFRYIPAWYKVHELLEQGVIGEIQVLTGFIGVEPMDQGWKATPETGGGPLLYVGSHLVDQVMWYLADEPVEVNASVLYRADTRADETSAFQIKFARGATAQLVVSQTGAGYYHSLHIYGREGSIHMRICGFLDSEIEVTSRVVEEYRQTKVLREPFEGDVRDVKQSHQLREFVDAIRTGQPTYVTAATARKVMETVDAVFASARRNEPVTLMGQVSV